MHRLGHIGVICRSTLVHWTLRTVVYIRLIARVINRQLSLA